MLSTAQDYRGDMAAINSTSGRPRWEPKLCFTTHPVEEREKRDTPGYWTGSAACPRAAQIRTWLSSSTKISTGEPLLTHRSTSRMRGFPRDKFDEIVEKQGGSSPGRRRLPRAMSGNLSLARSGARRLDRNARDGSARIVEIVGGRTKPGSANGTESDDGPFETFIDRICRARSRQRLERALQLPSQGMLEFGWRTTLRQERQGRSSEDYPRYEIPTFGRISHHDRDREPRRSFSKP